MLQIVRLSNKFFIEVQFIEEIFGIRNLSRDVDQILQPEDQNPLTLG